MTQPFTLHCLGRPRLLAPDGRPVRLKTRKHLALLVYLAVEPRVPQRRDRLTTLKARTLPPEQEVTGSNPVGLTSTNSSSSIVYDACLMSLMTRA